MSGDDYNLASAAEAAEAARRLLAAEGEKDEWSAVPDGWPPARPEGVEGVPVYNDHEPPVTVKTLAHGDGGYQAEAFATIWHHAKSDHGEPADGYVRRCVHYDHADDRFEDRYEWHDADVAGDAIPTLVLRRIEAGEADWPASLGGPFDLDAAAGFETPDHESVRRMNDGPPARSAEPVRPRHLPDGARAALRMVLDGFVRESLGGDDPAAYTLLVDHFWRELVAGTDDTGPLFVGDVLVDAHSSPAAPVVLTAADGTEAAWLEPDSFTDGAAEEVVRGLATAVGERAEAVTDDTGRRREDLVVEATPWWCSLFGEAMGEAARHEADQTPDDAEAVLVGVRVVETGEPGDPPAGPLVVAPEERAEAEP